MILLLDSAECDSYRGVSGWPWSGVLELKGDFQKHNCPCSLKLNISQMGRLDHVEMFPICSDL